MQLRDLLDDVPMTSHVQLGRAPNAGDSERVEDTSVQDTIIQDTIVQGLASDSRQVRPGYLFAALDGVQHQGRAFVDDAVKRGACAILSGRPLSDPISVPVVHYDDPRRALALCARAFFQFAPDYIAAVTGTNGKTSVAHFLRQIWAQAGFKAASMGTLGVQCGAYTRALQHTTPDPIMVHAQMRDLYAEGVSHCVVEASSHGLDQRRLDGLTIQLAGFTNLTHDHLDYHTTAEAYFDAKARLFDEVLVDDGVAVIFTDGAAGRDLVQRIKGRGVRMITVGTHDADLTLVQQRRHSAGQDLLLRHGDDSHAINVPIIGDFQIENIGVAVAMAMASGVALSDMALDTLSAPAGRMQWAGCNDKGAHIYVDYAHTPDALLRVLQTARGHAGGKVVLVFGCGGDRDQDKRTTMGAIAAHGADRVVITDDNPRSEAPDHIRAMIAAACPMAEDIADRRAAIHHAVAEAQAGDIVIIAGKGHETGQIIGDTIVPFNDLHEVATAVRGERSEVAHG